ncbi:hypothetical protein D9C73_004548 [Collichthys lucidus]|uniref:Uncharacterized protein n=1 Tax=Collichthys lucidus TaxID=240159 RepID=A0A4U5U8C8_COLLU|nr:hypothetical protein D9C73_004548 [Collichthys lucidus]
MVGAGGGCLSSASLRFVIPVEQEVSQSAPHRTAHRPPRTHRTGPPAHTGRDYTSHRTFNAGREEKHKYGGSSNNNNNNDNAVFCLSSLAVLCVYL